MERWFPAATYYDILCAIPEMALKRFRKASDTAGWRWLDRDVIAERQPRNFWMAQAGFALRASPTAIF